jgi:antitoxin VapB
MTLHIHNPEADRLAHEIAGRTGKSIDDVVLDALREQASHASGKALSSRQDATEEEIMEIARRCAALPDYDTRAPEEILYDKNGLPN